MSVEFDLSFLDECLKETKPKKIKKININSLYVESPNLIQEVSKTNIFDFKVSEQTNNNFDFLESSAPPDLFINNQLIGDPGKSISEPKNDLMSIIPKSRNNEYKGCYINDCKELPLIFEELLTDFKSFYIFGVSKQFSFLHSVMSILDPMYGSYTQQNRNTEIDCLFNKFLFEFPKMYNKFNYRKFGYKKESLQYKLGTNKKIDRSIQRYTSNYFNINILVVKIKYQKYYICGDYDPSILSIILINYDEYFEPIMSQNGNHYFKNAQQILEKGFNLEPSEEKKIMEISSSSEEEKQLKIKLFKKKKAPEIYELCEKLDIKIQAGLGKKKKKKDDLIMEIIACMD